MCQRPGCTVTNLVGAEEVVEEEEVEVVEGSTHCQKARRQQRLAQVPRRQLPQSRTAETDG
jgi:hypothetical protein